MLHLKIKLLPYGYESMEKEIGSVNIVNISTTEDDFADYRITILEPPREFIIKGHLRSDGYWPLIQRIAEEMSK